MAGKKKAVTTPSAPVFTTYGDFANYLVRAEQDKLADKMAHRISKLVDFINASNIADEMILKTIQNLSSTMLQQDVGEHNYERLRTTLDDFYAGIIRERAIIEFNAIHDAGPEVEWDDELRLLFNIAHPNLPTKVPQ